MAVKVKMSLSNIKVNNTLVTSVDNQPIENSTNLINSGSAFNLIRYSVFPGRVTGSTGAWVLNQGYHIVMKVYPENIIRIITKENEPIALYVIKSYNPRNNTSLELSSITGFNERVNIIENQDISLTMPSDAKYILIMVYGDYKMPSNMTINGLDYRMFIEDKSLLKKEVGNLRDYISINGLLRPNIWDTENGGKCAIIKVKPGDHIVIEPENGINTYAGVLRSYQIPVHNELGDFSQVTGFTTRIEVYE